MRDWSVPACNPGTLQFPTRSFPVRMPNVSSKQNHHLSLRSRHSTENADGPGQAALGRSAIVTTVKWPSATILRSEPISKSEPRTRASRPYLRSPSRAIVVR